MLEVKGLLDMVDLTSNISQQQQPITSPNNHSFRPESNPSISGEKREREREFPIHPLTHSSPIISTSTKISSAQSSSSPPYASYKQPYPASIFSQSTVGSRGVDLVSVTGPSQQEVGEMNDERGRNWPPLPISSLSRSAQSMLSSVYETGSDMNPLKRKKLSSISSMLSMPRDTPILRNVLAQTNAADSSQGMNPLSGSSISPTRGGASGDNNENNDTNNNENNGNNSGNASGGGNNGSVYVGYVRKSGDRSYHSSNGSDNSDKVFIIIKNFFKKILK